MAVPVLSMCESLRGLLMAFSTLRRSPRERRALKNVAHLDVQDRVPHRPPCGEGELISVVAPTSFVRHGFHPLLYEPL